MRFAALAFAWLVSRAWLIWLLTGPQEWVRGDVSYYVQSLDGAGVNGLSGTLVEYPLPALAVLAVPWVGAKLLGDLGLYHVAFISITVLIDLAYTVLLWHAARGRSLLPPAAWVVGLPLLGSTALVRFDLLPGVLCGLTVLLMGRRPAVAAVLASVATAAKFWPVLILPALLGVARTRRRVLVAIAATGLTLAGGSLLVAGWDRLVSPLTYQVERGLQVESVLATPVMVAWALVPDTWTIGYAPSKSYEITGPAVDTLIAASTLVTLLYVVALLLAWARLAWLARVHVDVSLETSVWLVLGAVSGFIVIGKVFSPQYVIWLLPIAAAALVVADSRSLRVWTGLLLVAAGLTHVVFPWNYGVVAFGTGAVDPVVAALALRNLVFVWLFLIAAGHVWRGLRSPQRGSAADRQPSGPGLSGDRTAR